jgi:nicotinate-nucleotide adenylyltransferase
MKQGQRIGIFGGTFDPIHCGHLRAARLIERMFHLDKILFVPASVPPHKARPDMAPAADRMKMVRLALGRRVRWTACSIEIRAAGPSFSILTIDKLRRRFPRARFFFITGADAFLEIRTWREWKRVLANCPFIVMARPGFDPESAARALGPAYRKGIRRIKGQAWAAEVDHRATLGVPAAVKGRSFAAAQAENEMETGRIFLASIDALPISSTGIRKLAGDGQSLAGFVPPAVAAHIRTQGLYQNRPVIQKGRQTRPKPECAQRRTRTDP